MVGTAMAVLVRTLPPTTSGGSSCTREYAAVDSAADMQTIASFLIIFSPCT
jgi:hypothetical protein